VKRTVTRAELETPLLPYADAVELVVGSFEPLAPQPTVLADALHLVCADDVVSDIDVPGFDSSAMDGYAVRSSDTSPTRHIIGDAPAGAADAPEVLLGTAVKIMTGGEIPLGADAVVPWEDTEAHADEITILRMPAPRHHVRPAGEDVRAGDTVISRGATLTAVHLGVLASIGRVEVAVHPRPRVAILSTGDEVVPPGEKLRAAAVYDANATLLAAMASSAGGIVAAARWLADDPAAITQWLNDIAADADLVVTTGGASVGEHDWLRDVLSRDGKLDMWRVAMKPGKPVAFGSVGGTRVLALPGNPGSAFACAHTFVVPAIRAMAGRAPGHERVTATLAEDVKGSPSRTLLCRVRLGADSTATPLPAQSSVVLSNLLPADGFAIVPPGGAAAGSDVPVELFDY